MDVDILNTSAEDNCIDVMAMMMQMDKFPEFYDPFYSNQTCSDDKQPILQGNSCMPSQALMTDPSSSAAFVSNIVIQAPAMPPLQSNAITGRLKSTANNTAYLYPSSEKKNSMAAMREMIFHIAAMQPIHIDPESIKPPKRRNVKISTDPQSVAARHRRERISERIRILQRLVPGGTKMDTASMLDEAIHYVKFLKKQVQTLEQAGARRPMGVSLPRITNTNSSYFSGGQLA